MTTSTKDQIRAATLGSNIQRKRIPYTFPDGAQIELVQPSFAERNEIMAAAGVKAGKEADLKVSTRAGVLAVVRTAVVAGTAERVWSDADVDTLMSDNVAGGWLDELTELAGSLLGGKKKDGAGGNGSATTPSEGSSST